MKFYNCLIMCKLHNIIIIKNMKAKTILYFKFKRFTFIEEKAEDNKVRIKLR